jgi:iron complex outermembrane receptor protein
VNDPSSYTARGLEAGLSWNATHGLDVRGSAAFQMVTADQPIAVCGPCSQAPVAKLNVGVSYRTPVKLELSADASWVSGTTWVEREPSPSDPTQIANAQNPLAAYAVVNARAGYRFFDDRATFAVVGTQLGPPHQEHPFGNLISRRVMAVLTVQP